MKFISQEKFRIVKQIIIITDHKKIEDLRLGYILYERPLDSTYKLLEQPKDEANHSINFDRQNIIPSDEIDTIILGGVKNTYPKSFSKGYSVIFEFDEKTIQALQNNQFVNSEITFAPDTSHPEIYTFKRSYDGLRKPLKIYNDLRIEDISHLAFIAQYDIKNEQILSKIDEINFI